MPSVVGTMTKGAVFDSVVKIEDAGNYTDMDAKGTPVNGDLIVIADSADGYDRKKVEIGDLPSGGGGISEELAIAYAITL